MRFFKSLGMFLGRACIAAVFLATSFGKITNWDGVTAFMASKGMTMIPLFLGAATAIELLGGLCLLLGFKTRLAGLLLALFLIPVTAIFHDFWAVEGAARDAQMVQFLKNLAIFGGLLFIGSVGAGRFAIDPCECPHKIRPLQE